ncbi:MAG: glycosyltransferase family 4 protein [Candidatus Hodarchaeota archaeon]
MKILRISGEIYPEMVGGLPIHVENISKAQSDMGLYVEVFSTNYKKLKSIEYRKNILYRHYFEICRPLDNPIIPTLFFGVLRHLKRFDIIHAHSHLYFSTIIAALIRKLNLRPLVITNHGFFSQSSNIRFQNLYLRTFGKWTLRAADRIICYEENEKNLLMKYDINPSKIAIIPNSIDTSLFPPKDKVFSNIILWVGRFKKLKAPDILIRGFREATLEYPDLKLIMIGNGSEKKKIEELINSLSLESKVEILEFVPVPEMHKYYQKADIFVLSSYKEGMPRSLMEAITSGVPCICTNLPQLKGNFSGLIKFFNKGNFMDLAEKISNTIENYKVAKETALKNSTFIKNNFPWRKTVIDTIKLYADLIKEFDNFNTK